MAKQRSSSVELHKGDNASLAFEASVVALVDRVRESIGALRKSRKLNEWAPGALHALAKVCAGERQLVTLNRGEVEEWREVFFAWLERVEKKQDPLARAPYRESAESAFAAIVDASTDWPEHVWRDSSRERHIAVTFPNDEARMRARTVANERHPVALGSALHEYLRSCIEALTAEPSEQRPATHTRAQPPLDESPAIVSFADGRFSMSVEALTELTAPESLAEDYVANAFDLEAAMRAGLSRAHLKDVEFDCESSLFTLHTQSPDALSACLQLLSKVASEKIRPA